MNKEIELIREEMAKITGYLLENLNLSIKELKPINYGIKFEVVNKENRDKGILVLYYGKKGFKFVDEKPLIGDVFKEIKEVFNNRDTLSGGFFNDKNDNVQMINKKDYINNEKVTDTIPNIRFLQKLYRVLKPYECEEFDFSEFANELQKSFQSEADKNELEKNKYNFRVLELYYRRLIGE